MISVFSNIIKSGIIPHCKKLKPSEIIEALAKSPNASYSRFIIAGPEDEPLYMLKPAVIHWLEWVNTNILFRITPKIDPRTIGVRVRIATNMLNIFEMSGIIPKYICVTYHKRLVDNVNGIMSEVFTEDLPF